MRGRSRWSRRASSPSRRLVRGVAGDFWSLLAARAGVRRCVRGALGCRCVVAFELSVRRAAHGRTRRGNDSCRGRVHDRPRVRGRRRGSSRDGDAVRRAGDRGRRSNGRTVRCSSRRGARRGDAVAARRSTRRPARRARSGGHRDHRPDRPRRRRRQSARPSAAEGERRVGRERSGSCSPSPLPCTRS